MKRGVIHSGAILLDAVALGLWRKTLVQNFGTVAARSVLTQFGFAQGWRMAAVAKSELTWDSEQVRRLSSRGSRTARVSALCSQKMYRCPC